MKEIKYIVTLLFLAMNLVSKTNTYEKNLAGDIFIDAHNELHQGIMNSRDEEYSINIDEISKHDSRKRLLYLLNFRESRLAKVKINSRMNFIAKKSEPKPEERGSSPLERPVAGKSVFKRKEEPSLSLGTVLSLRNKNILLSTFSFNNIEYSDFSEKSDTNFLSILGLSREIRKNGTLDLNLFIHRKEKDEFRLEKFSTSYLHKFTLRDDFYFEPRVTLFLPIYSDQNFKDEVYGDSTGIVLSPGVNLRMSFLNKGDIHYSLNYYHNTHKYEKRSFLNIIKFHQSMGRFHMAFGLSALTRNDEGTSGSKFISSYYTVPMMNSRAMQVVFLIQNKPFSLTNLDYSLNLSYNF